jgi:hypothetical protein
MEHCHRVAVDQGNSRRHCLGRPGRRGQGVLHRFANVAVGLVPGAGLAVHLRDAFGLGPEQAMTQQVTGAHDEIRPLFLRVGKRCSAWLENETWQVSAGHEVPATCQVQAGWCYGVTRPAP